MNKFTVPQVPGSSRKTQREYTHAIIGRFDKKRYAADLDSRLAGKDNKTARSNFNHYKKIVTEGVGGRWTESPWCGPIDQKMFDHAVALLKKNGDTWEKWLERSRQEEREHSAQLQEAPAELKVLQWSMSLKNASNAISQWINGHYLTNVMIVETVQVK